MRVRMQKVQLFTHYSVTCRYLAELCSKGNAIMYHGLLVTYAHLNISPRLAQINCSLSLQIHQEPGQMLSRIDNI